MSKTTSVTVIIPTFRRLDILGKCLEGVFMLDRRPDQVLVVYRAEGDPETSQWLREDACKLYSGLQLVPVFSPGVVAALNAGLEKAESEVIAIFDDDAVPQPDWLSRVLVHFNQPDVGAVGGRDLVYGFPPVKEATKAGVRDWWGNIIGNHHIVVGTPRDVEVVKGCNWILRRSALGTLRLDERLLGIGAQFANELWFCLNLRHAGWRIILDPSAMVDHYPAVKPDHLRTEFSRNRCYESACNRTAAELAFTSWHLRLRTLVYYVFVGCRECPGLFFILRGVLKRPRHLPAQLQGGWLGFWRGWKLAQEFRRNPPGLPNSPPVA